MLGSGVIGIHLSTVVIIMYKLIISIFLILSTTLISVFAKEDINSSVNSRPFQYKAQQLRYNEDEVFQKDIASATQNSNPASKPTFLIVKVLPNRTATAPKGVYRVEQNLLTVENVMDQNLQP